MSLANDRNTPRFGGDFIEQAMAAVRVYSGALVMRDATGYLTKGQAALGLMGVGVADRQVDNSGGSAGSETLRVRTGDVFRFDNSSSADAITIADIGRPCFAVDDQTVARTDGRTAGLPTRSPAGIVVDVDDQGVRVLMDELRLRAVMAGLRTFVPIRVATLVGTGVYRVQSPVRGKIVQINSIIEGVLTTGDATLTGKINGTAITSGVITITQSGSAAGDKDYCNPTAAASVVVGDEISLTVGGTNATASVANCLVEIERA